MPETENASGTIGLTLSVSYPWKQKGRPEAAMLLCGSVGSVQPVVVHGWPGGHLADLGERVGRLCVHFRVAGIEPTLVGVARVEPELAERRETQLFQKEPDLFRADPYHQLRNRLQLVEREQLIGQERVGRSVFADYLVDFAIVFLVAAIGLVFHELP